MNTLSLPNMPPYGEIMIFLYDKHIEIMMHQSTLRKCRPAAAIAFDNYSEKVKRYGDGCLSFTYYRLGWFELCIDLMEQEKNEATFKATVAAGVEMLEGMAADDTEAKAKRRHRRNAK